MSHYRIRVALIGTFCQLLWLMTCAMPLDAFAAGKDLESLVAPIALYPDPLLAQVLAASTNPAQVDAANTWVAAHSNVTGDALTKAVAKNNWDPSVKELTHFPGVLSKMSSNRAWSSALGAAYTNDPGAVMSAVQSLRRRAKDAGKLTTNTEMKVVESKQNIVIQSASPQTVYVPSYNPTAVYGQPVAAYPGYSGTDMALSNMVSFGTGIGLGALAFGGKNGWGVNWGQKTVVNKNKVFNASNHNWQSGDINAGDINDDSHMGDIESHETDASDLAAHGGEHDHSIHGDEHEHSAIHGGEHEHLAAHGDEHDHLGAHGDEHDHLGAHDEHDLGGSGHLDIETGGEMHGHEDPSEHLHMGGDE
jgi:hypothetical protein